MFGKSSLVNFDKVCKMEKTLFERLLKSVEQMIEIEKGEGVVPKECIYTQEILRDSHIENAL